MHELGLIVARLVTETCDNVGWTRRYCREIYAEHILTRIYVKAESVLNHTKYTSLTLN